MKRTYKNTYGDGRVEYVEYEIDEITEEQTAYTAEQLEAMTSEELSAILAEIGVSDVMDKENMIDLILYKQKGELT